jgi:hypothetical protein
MEQTVPVSAQKLHGMYPNKTVKENYHQEARRGGGAERG